MSTEQTKRLRVAVLGSGNIGTDLMYKIAREPSLELRMVAGIDPQSEGLARARSLGFAASSDGIDAIAEDDRIELVFDATSAAAHKLHAVRLREKGMRAIDLTPAKMGPSVVPCVNMAQSSGLDNVNLISCAAQATIPLVYGFSRVGKLQYAEIVATLASKGAGPGARANIEEFTHTTQSAIEEIGRATRGKAMVIFNPAAPEINMRNAIYVKFEGEVDPDEVTRSVLEMAEQVKQYVPGYKVTVEPFLRGDHYMVSVEVTGAGDYLPTYAGNLDIINAAAIAVARQYATRSAAIH